VTLSSRVIVDDNPGWWIHVFLSYSGVVSLEP